MLSRLRGFNLLHFKKLSFLTAVFNLPIVRTLCHFGRLGEMMGISSLLQLIMTQCQDGVNAGCPRSRVDAGEQAD